MVEEQQHQVGEEAEVMVVMGELMVGEVEVEVKLKQEEQELMEVLQEQEALD